MITVCMCDVIIPVIHLSELTSSSQTRRVMSTSLLSTSVRVPSPSRFRRRGRGHTRIVATASLSSSDVAAMKKELLQAVAASRKPGADATQTKRTILDRTVALESGVDASTPFGEVSGRWSLVYSTNDDKGTPGLGPLQGVIDTDAIQQITSQLYKVFFSFAPALAGSTETGAKGVANEQVVDIPNGRVENNVDVDLPWPIGGARIGVNGEVAANDPEGREVVVTFTSWELGPKPGGAGGDPPSLRLPLPRPKGVLRNTFCDDTLRISRGGRGGVFITSRID